MDNIVPVFKNELAKQQIFAAYDGIINSIGISFEENYISTRLGGTHVLVSGKMEKPPVVLIHAFYATSASWYRNLKLLSEDFRVYAVDIIGDPNKSKPIRLLRSTNDFVDWFNDLLDGLDLGQAHFIGNSVGAFHITNFALHSPERVQKMVLIGPAATFLQIMPFYAHTFPGGMTGWPFLVKHAVKWIENGVPFEHSFHKLFYLNLKYGKSANQVFPRVFKDEELKQIESPVLLIYGEKEVIYNINLAVERAEKFVKNLQAVIIPNANHITAASTPLSANDAIMKFLNSPYSSSPITRM